VQWPALCVAMCLFLYVHQMRSCNVGTREVRIASVIFSEFLCTHFEECFAITVLWDVT